MARPRFTIQTLMGLIAGFALVFALGPGFGSVIVMLSLILLGPIGVGWVAWWLTQGSAERAGWLLLVAVVPASLGTAWLCVYPLPLGGHILVLMAAWLTAPTLIAGALAWTEAHQRRRPARRSVGLQTLVIGAAGMPLSMAVTLWPLHLAFQMARPGMIRLADQVAAGQRVQFPQHLGVYTIVAVRVDPNHVGNVAILLDADPNGETGFVRIVEPPQADFNGSLGIVPSDYQISLTGQWAYWVED